MGESFTVCGGPWKNNPPPPPKSLVRKTGGQSFVSCAKLLSQRKRSRGNVTDRDRVIKQVAPLLGCVASAWFEMVLPVTGVHIWPLLLSKTYLTISIGQNQHRAIACYFYFVQFALFKRVRAILRSITVELSRSYQALHCTGGRGGCSRASEEHHVSGEPRKPRTRLAEGGGSAKVTCL